MTKTKYKKYVIGNWKKKEVHKESLVHIHALHLRAVAVIFLPS